MTHTLPIDSKEFLERAQSNGIIPVISVPDADLAEPLADTLWQAGISIVEITFRTTEGAQAIRNMRRTHPRMLVGAGTVISPSDVESAIDAGAMFALSPSTLSETLTYTAKRSLTFIPGVMTPSDIAICLQNGLHIMKFFPATQAGGPDMLSALYAPFEHLDVKIIPTGGVTLDNIEQWLKLDNVVAVGGSWIARSTDLIARNWEVIYDRAKNAAATIAALRQSSS